MKSLNFAILFIIVALCAVAFTLCTGTERCIDGHGEFTGRECK